MNLTNLYNSVNLIQPEIAITITLLLIVVVDLIFKENKKLIPYIAIIGSVVGAILVIAQFNATGFAFGLSENANPNFGMVAVDKFGSFFKLLVILTTIVIVLFSLSSDEIKKIYPRTGEYYALVFGMLLGMMFLIGATDLVLIYLSLELLSLSSYVLAGFTKLRDRNSEAALKYLIFGAVSSGFMIFGISIYYGLTGETNLYLINPMLQNPNVNILTLSFATLLIIAGIGYKISSVPFHFWTPDVYEGAPITITTYLSVASKAAGFALLIRFIRAGFVAFVQENGHWTLNSSFDWVFLIALLSILTMTLGNLTALWQDNLKRMLAYSSVAHAGYLLLGVVALSNQGVLGVFVYFAFYAITNLAAFYIVMLIANKIGSENIDDYRGLGHTSPLLGVSFTIILISLVGLPPTAGFIGKLYLFFAILDKNMLVLATIAILNTVVSLYYYIRVVKHMFLYKPNEETPSIRLSVGPKTLLSVLTMGVLYFGVYPSQVIDFAQDCLQFLGF